MRPMVQVMLVRKEQPSRRCPWLGNLVTEGLMVHLLASNRSHNSLDYGIPKCPRHHPHRSIRAQSMAIYLIRN